MTRLIVGPFNRVEGDLEVHLELEAERVITARVSAPMYRGFEQILQQRHPLDAMVYVPRICGICSVSQSVAAARALADAMGVRPPPNGRIATNLMQATENLADHLTHFYLFFMPDFTRSAYREQGWHAQAERCFDAQQGEHVRRAIAARQRWLTLLGILAGKWPHSQSIQPGGSSRAIEPGERLRMLGTLREFRSFLEQTLFAAPLERIAALRSEAELQAWRDEAAPDCGDLRLFLTIADDAGLRNLGPGPGLYLSYGSYPLDVDRMTFARGVWDAGAAERLALDTSAIREDSTHAWLAGDGDPRHPSDGLTVPLADKEHGYSWNKAPRLDGRVLETGALARQLVHGHPLMRDVAGRWGANVYTRVLGRLLELALVLPEMERWLGDLAPGQPYFSEHPPLQDAEGVGLTEAARGALGHWLRIHDGKIANYQIIAPTSWNFSPRDALGIPGALEAALVGAPVRPGETTPVAVQHIVRSFDPCMVCTVH